MSRVDGNSDDARFGVTVWEEKSTYFSTKQEAEAEFQRLRALRTFGVGELYEWADIDEEWIEANSFNHFKST